ncbi:C-type lectin-like [Trinorchestia longiramus]|nr:C-type lectin-like [Trinorchestia longiramus]
MNFRMWPLVVAGLTSGVQLKSSTLVFYETYYLESDTSYVKPTHTGSMSECSSLCLRYGSAGIRYDWGLRECVIFPTATRVIKGEGVYARDGWLVDLLTTTGYIKVGDRFVWPQLDKTDANGIVTLCAKVFAFGTIFVPKSGLEMALVAENLNDDQTDEEMWIGLNDLDNEGIPMWDDGTSYTGLEDFVPMRWKGDEEQKDNKDDHNRVTVKWKKSDSYWETKFKKDTDDVNGVLCQVELY